MAHNGLLPNNLHRLLNLACLNNIANRFFRATGKASKSPKLQFNFTDNGNLMNETSKSSHERLREARKFSADLRGYFQERTKHLKFMAEFESKAVEPWHQLDQVKQIHDEALEFFDEFLELTEAIPATKKNRHILPHVQGEVRNIQKNMEKFVEQIKATHNALMGQLNSPTRTSTGEFESLFDFIIACLDVAKDKLSSRQSVKLQQVRKRRKKKKKKRRR